jgi:hypothetical protein
VAEFDFDAARRWARFDPERTLSRRGDDELPFANPGLIGGQGLLLDTCVYIDQMQNRSPQVLDDLIAQRQVNHSTVAIQELMHTVGVLDPSDARTSADGECQRLRYPAPAHTGGAGVVLPQEIGPLRQGSVQSLTPDPRQL